MVGTLLGAGADPNGLDDTGLTPLHLAASAGQIRTVILLVRRGAVPAMPDPQGRTAAERAEQAGHTGLASWLRA